MVAIWWTLALSPCSVPLTSLSPLLSPSFISTPLSFQAICSLLIKVRDCIQTLAILHVYSILLIYSTTNCYTCRFFLICFDSLFLEIQSLAKPITTATMDLYDRIVRDLPPTPSKFHYIFNLRDLSRIYHGLSQTTPERFDSPDSIVRVWRNECLRVFYDRLTNDKDKTLVTDHINELIQEHFSSHSEVGVSN